MTWPFSQYASSSNTNDSIAPALLVWGFLALTSPVARGVCGRALRLDEVRLAPAAAALVGLPGGAPRRAAQPSTSAAFALTTLLVFFVVFLEPSPLHAVRVFYDRTVSFQIGRDSPFSLWDWRQYHAKGIPDLHLVQRVLQVLLVVGSLALAWFPRRRSPLRLAALTGAVLVGFELVLTHWFYLYLPWFFPFVALALVAAPPGEPKSPPAPVEDDEPSLALLPVR